MDSPNVVGGYLAECSATIGALAEALSAAQAELENVKMDASNPYYKSKYATLAAVVRASAPILSKHGLSVTQLAQQGDGTSVSVRTVLMHKSGEYISGVLTMVPVKADPQGIGSCLSYARRYSLMAIIGLASTDEDDDGNAATHKTPPKVEPKSDEPAPDPPTKKFLTAMYGISEQMAELLAKNGIENAITETKTRLDRILGSEGYTNLLEVSNRDHRKIVYNRWKETFTEATKFYTTEEKDA